MDLRLTARSLLAPRAAAFLGRPMTLGMALGLCSFIPVLMAAARVVQIPLGGLPADTLRLASTPVAFFLHALSGVLFGVLGPLQFVRTLRSRFGAVHRVAGRVFVLAAVVLALSGLSLLLQVESMTTSLLDAARGVFGLALLGAIMLGLAAARRRDFGGHRAWMIRAYAIGMGTGPVALVLFPIYLITGEPIAGLAADIAVVGVWLLTILVAEGILRRLA
jgi:uncharacterized membrane protein